MARPTNDTPRVLGPYWHETKQEWIAKIYLKKGDEPKCRLRTRSLGADEKVAKDWVDEARAKLEVISIEIALTRYRLFLVETGHKKPNTDDSADETVRRLRLFFEGVIDKRVSQLTEEKGEELYRAFAARTYTVGPKKAPRQKPYQPAHHRHTLAQAKSFLQWCVKPKRWITENPLEEVKGFGESSNGKEQLTGDEAIKFYEWCAYKAHRGDEAALGLVMLLLMALRQGDVRKRVVRDVDLGGTVLRIGVGSSKRSKSKKGDRPRRIPVVLQPLIQRLVKDRSPLEPLFVSARTRDFHGSSWLRAAAHRFCKEASVPYVCPHGLKGTAGTLATDSGALADQVAEYLSHESTKITKQSYIADGAAADAVASTALKVITGGRR